MIIAQKSAMKIPNCTCFLVDIDGTLSDYREKSLNPEKLLHGNFLFPIICDMMVETGWEKEEAEQAILELTKTNVFWDYSDFIAEFELPVQETFRRMRQWHRDNLIACETGISVVRELHAIGKKLFIMSNNPYLGCIFKLQVAGLADNDFYSPYFERIFGTNILRGCKSSRAVWLRALAQIPADPSDICVIGDNPVEDCNLPRQCGISHSILLGEVETYQEAEAKEPELV